MHLMTERASIGRCIVRTEAVLLSCHDDFVKKDAQRRCFVPHFYQSNRSFRSSISFLQNCPTNDLHHRLVFKGCCPDVFGATNLVCLQFFIFRLKNIHSVGSFFFFFFFHSKIANSFYSKINDSSGVRTTSFLSGRSGFESLSCQIFLWFHWHLSEIPIVHMAQWVGEQDFEAVGTGYLHFST